MAQIYFEAGKGGGGHRKSSHQKELAIKKMYRKPLISRGIKIWPFYNHAATSLAKAYIVHEIKFGGIAVM